jgi:ferric-chelate reductase
MDGLEERKLGYFHGCCHDSWGFFIVIAAFYNLIGRVFFASKHLKSHPINLMRKWVTLPSLASYRKRAQPVQYLKVIGGYLPTRSQFIAIFLYFAMVIVLSAVGYTNPSSTSTSASSHGGEQRSKIAQNIGDGTGIMASFGFLLTFLFGGRTNFLL